MTTWIVEFDNSNYGRIKHYVIIMTLMITFMLMTIFMIVILRNIVAQFYQQQP